MEPIKVSNYLIFPNGKMYSVITGKEIKGRVGNHGYQYVTIEKKNVLVHRLMAKHFIGDLQDKEVNHKDGNKLNNCAENLEWVTRAENIRHAYANGLFGKRNTDGKKLLVALTLKTIQPLIRDIDFDNYSSIHKLYNANRTKAYT